MRNNDRAKSVLYIVLTAVILLLMGLATTAGIKKIQSTKAEKARVAKIAKEKAKKQAEKERKSTRTGYLTLPPSSSSTSSSSSSSSSSEASSSSETQVVASSTASETTSSSSTADATSMPTPEQVASSSQKPTFRYKYIAVGGDTLQTISNMTGVAVDVIASSNGLTGNITLAPGQEIYVP